MKARVLPPTPAGLPEYEVLLTLVVLYLAHKVTWYDDDSVIAEVVPPAKPDGPPTTKPAAKSYKIDLGHLSQLESVKYLRLYESGGAHGSLMLTGKGRRAAQKVVHYYQLEIV